jgi:hypothetical protein
MVGISALVHPSYVALAAAVCALLALVVLMRRPRPREPDVLTLLRETDAAAGRRRWSLVARLRRWGARARRSVRHVAIPSLAVVVAIGFSGFLWLVTPYAPRGLMRAHPMNCAQARAMGFADARIGTEGYFRHLDADNDGISCESLWASQRRW